MKVENVKRVENNTENFNYTSLEKDTSSSSQTSQGKNMTLNNVEDIVDIDANAEFSKNLEAENLTDKASTKNETVFYNGKNIYNQGKNSEGANSKTMDTENLSMVDKSIQGKMLYGKNEYSKTANFSNTDLKNSGKEYGNANRLDTFSNPEFNTSKSAFYNSPKGRDMVGGNADTTNGFANTGTSKVTDGANSMADSSFAGANKSGDVIMNSMPVPRGLSDISGRGIAENQIVDSESKNVSGNTDLNAQTFGKSVNSNSSNSVLDGEIGKRSNSYGLKSNDHMNVMNKFDNGVDSRNYNAGEKLNSSGNKSGYAENRDMNFISENGVKNPMRIHNDTTSRTANGDVVRTGGYIIGRESVTDNSEQQTINSRNSDVSGFDRVSGFAKEGRGVSTETKQRGVEIRRKNVDAQEYISAQMAYQGIIRRNITDIYKGSPELDKLIVLLFRLRKLTLKKIETSNSDIFEKRSVEEDAELILNEVKSFVENEEYKKGKAINVLQQFLDEQEKIKACVGLSPFPIEIKDFERFFNGVKSETENIKDQITKERLNEMLKSIFRVILLAFFVVIIYILFLR